MSKRTAAFKLTCNRKKVKPRLGTWKQASSFFLNTKKAGPTWRYQMTHLPDNTTKAAHFLPPQSMYVRTRKSKSNAWRAGIAETFTSPHLGAVSINARSSQPRFIRHRYNCAGGVISVVWSGRKWKRKVIKINALKVFLGPVVLCSQKKFFSRVCAGFVWRRGNIWNEPGVPEKFVAIRFY